MLAVMMLPAMLKFGSVVLFFERLLVDLTRITMLGILLHVRSVSRNFVSRHCGLLISTDLHTFVQHFTHGKFEPFRLEQAVNTPVFRNSLSLESAQDTC